jgi:hypothetical protein
MIPIGKLAKLATGSLSADDILEVASSLGAEVAFAEVPEDRKEDAFQRVAQFSMLDGAHMMHGTVLMKDGSRIELIGVIRSPDGSNRGYQKTIDRQEPAALLSCQST